MVLLDPETKLEPTMEFEVEAVIDITHLQLKLDINQLFIAMS